jgi:predicted nucleic acid-binding protein
VIISNELIGRKVAESLELQISGSVGILIRAKQLGEIAAIKPLLEQMVRKGMYFSRRFLDAVLRQVGE